MARYATIAVSHEVKEALDDIREDVNFSLQDSGMSISSADELISYMITCTAVVLCQQDKEQEELADKIAASRDAAGLKDGETLADRDARLARKPDDSETGEWVQPLNPSLAKRFKVKVEPFPGAAEAMARRSARIAQRRDQGQVK